MRSLPYSLFGAIIVLVICCQTVTSTLVAQSSNKETTNGTDLPEARLIIDKFVEAIGGEMNLRSIESVKLKGKKVYGTNELSFESLVSGGRFVTRSTYSGLLTADVFNGYDGEFLWATGPGVSKKDDDKETSDRQLINIAPHLAALSWLEFDGQITVTKKEKINGRDVWCLKFRKSEFGKLGPYTAFRYFDIESGLLVRSVWKVDSLEEDTINEFEYHEESFSGLRFWARRTTERKGSPKQEIEFESIEISPNLPDDAFDIPESLHEQN